MKNKWSFCSTTSKKLQFGGQCDTSIGQEALITTSSALYILSGFSVHSLYTSSTQLVHS